MDQFTLLAICGPARSGKDLVADYFVEKGFAKVALADPIKRFAMKVFAYDEDTLWGDTENKKKVFRYTEKEWVDIITRCAAEANSFLMDVLQWGRMADLPSEVDPVQAYLSLSNWIHDMRGLHNITNEDGGNAGLTPREVLQTLGTEWGRKVHRKLWINYLLKVVMPGLKVGRHYNRIAGLTNPAKDKPAYIGIAVPDERFLNEIESVEEAGGYNARLRRLAMEEENKTSNVGIKDHSSEVELRNIPDSRFDLVLETEEGVDKVRAQLDKVYEERAWETRRKGSSSTVSTSEESPPISA